MNRNHEVFLLDLVIAGFEVGHVRTQDNFLVFADKAALDASVMSQKQRVAAFPSDGDSSIFPDGVGELHVLVEVVGT